MVDYNKRENVEKSVFYTPPKAANIFEGSRIFVHPALLLNSENNKEDTNKILRRNIVAELFLSQLEVANDLGINAYIGTMWPEIHKTTFGRIGWDLEIIGRPSTLRDADGTILDNGRMTQTFFYPVNPNVERKIRSITGIFDRVTRYPVVDQLTGKAIEFLGQSTRTQTQNNTERHKIKCPI